MSDEGHTTGQGPKQGQEASRADSRICLSTHMHAQEEALKFGVSVSLGCCAELRSRPLEEKLVAYVFPVKICFTIQDTAAD